MTDRGGSASARAINKLSRNIPTSVPKDYADYDKGYHGENVSKMDDVILA